MKGKPLAGAERSLWTEFSSTSGGCDAQLGKPEGTLFKTIVGMLPLGTTVRKSTDWIRRLLQRNAAVPRILAQAKRLPPRELEALLHEARRYNALRPFLTRNHYPTLAELGTPGPLPQYVDLESEANWTVETLRVFGSQLSALLQLKRECEQKVLAGDHAAAELTLAHLTDTHGWSLWAIELILLLKQLTSGTKGRHEQLAQITESGSDIVHFLALLFNNRADEAISPSQYDRDIQTIFRKYDLDEQFGFALAAIVNFTGSRDWPPENIAYTLRFLNDFSLLDRYLFLTKVFQLGCTIPQLWPKHATLVNHVHRLNSALNQPELKQLSTFLNPLELQPTATHAAVLAVADRYTVGDYSGTIKECIRQLDASPDTLEFAELCARATSHLGTSAPDCDCPLSKEITRHLTTLAAKTPHQTSAATQRLLSLAHLYAATSLGPRLFAFVSRKADLNHPLAVPVFEFVTSTTVSASSVEAFDTPKRASTFLAGLRKLHADSPSILLFSSTRLDLQKGETAQLEETVPRERRLKYQARALESSGDYSEAIKVLSPLATPRVDTSGWYDPLTLLLRCLAASARHDEATTLAADAYLCNRDALTRSQLQRIAQHVPTRLSQANAHASHLVVLYGFQHATRGTTDAQELYPALDALLQRLAIKRPSQLEEGAVPTEKLIFVLDHICQAEVLDWSVEFESSADLENERISICRLLQRLDPGNASRYLEEIDRSTKAAAIRAVMHTATRSKVYVDIPGIRKGLAPEFTEAFEVFQHREKLTRDLENILARVYRIRKLTSSRDLILIATTEVGQVLNATFAAFCELFAHLKDRFIASDDCGLDSYLSVRIRHGTLAGQLRGTFERSNLITRRSAEGAYIPNQQWIGHLATQSAEKLTETLSRFSSRIDSLIEKAKGTWIQILSPSHPDGAFDFTYTEAELNGLYMDFRNSEALDTFIDGAMAELWKRTGECLARLRTRITDQLGTEFISALDELDAAARSLAGTPHALLQTIAMCRTQIQNELAIVASWFEIREVGVIADYEATALVNAALMTVRRNLGEAFSPEVAVACEAQLLGSTLPHMLDILNIVLENMVKHSASESRHQVTFARRSDRLVVETRNRVPDALNEEKLRNKARQLESYASALPGSGVKTEGGSGYIKLGKILRYDLECEDAHIVIDTSNHEFFVRVDLPFSTFEGSQQKEQTLANSNC